MESLEEQESRLIANVLCFRFAVCNAGRWSSGGSFSSFNTCELRDPCAQADRLYKAGPMVAVRIVVVVTTASSGHRLETCSLSFVWARLVPIFLSFGRGGGVP